MDRAKAYKPSPMIRDVYDQPDTDSSNRFKEIGLSPFALVGSLNSRNNYRSSRKYPPAHYSVDFNYFYS